MKKIFSIAFLFFIVAAHAQKFTTFRQAGKVGYKDEKGSIVIPAKYDEADYLFVMGMAKVKLNNKYGFINRKGQEVIRLQYDSAAEFSYFGTADVVLGKKRIRIDTNGKSVPFDPKTFNAADFDISSFDFSDLDFFTSNKLKALGQANVICDRFTSGNYNGEVFNDTKPGGYGCYVFADSSFYCGLSDNGSANGNGVLYDKTNNCISIGKWSNGKLTGDYYIVRLNEYKVQVYSATAGAPLFRAAMQINGKYVITSNLIHPYAADKHNLINILDAGGVSTMYGKLDDNLQFNGNYASFDSPDEMLKVNNSNHGVYVNNVFTRSYTGDAVITAAESSLGYKIPSILYPKKLIRNFDDKEDYFGRTEGSSPKGFGSIVSPGSNYHLITGMFNGSGAPGFKQEIINGKDNKYFFSGDFKIAHSANSIEHSGDNYAKVVYFANNDVTINAGSFISDDKFETLVKGIIVNVKPGFASILFVTNEGNEDKINIGKGYLMLPGKNVIYRGGLDLASSNAEGLGEMSGTSGNYKNKYAAGKAVNPVDDIPAWSAPVFTRMFDVPFKMVEDK